MDPVILLTPKFSPDPESAQEQLVRLKESYFQAVTLAGGIPVLAGNADPKGYAQLADGLLLTGGIDIEPARYGQVVLSKSVVATAAWTIWKLAFTRLFLLRANRFSAYAAGSS